MENSQKQLEKIYDEWVEKIKKIPMEGTAASEILHVCQFNRGHYLRYLRIFQSLLRK